VKRSVLVNDVLHVHRDSLEVSVSLLGLCIAAKRVYVLCEHYLLF
jgi:hypothetical protein